MNAEQAKKLREPFKPEQIGKLPKAGIMLDYVGHAATTDRLLQVDPEWTWEPMGIGPNGEPLMTNGGMWIKLTVCGVTRPGFGDGKNPKEIIGDAIRNAAMRFGVALDLWAKEDLNASGDEPKADKKTAKSAPQSGKTASVPQAAESEPASSPDDFSFADRAAEVVAKQTGKSSPKQQKQIGDLILELAALRKTDIQTVTETLEADLKKPLNDLSPDGADALIAKLDRWRSNLKKAA
jgi:hypothetical protein